MFPHTRSPREFRRGCSVRGGKSSSSGTIQRDDGQKREMFGTMNKIRIAIVGCGYWGQNLIRNFSESADVEVTAVCDFNLNALARMKRRYPTVELKQDYQQVLSDSRIHAVVIATPVSTHYPFAEQALRAGKHVSGREAAGDEHPAGARLDGTRG